MSAAELDKIYPGGGKKKNQLEPNLTALVSESIRFGISTC